MGAIRRRFLVAVLGAVAALTAASLAQQKPAWLRGAIRQVHLAGNPHVVALSFDDGPTPRWTPEVLNLLHRFGASATFFVVGSPAARPARGGEGDRMGRGRRACRRGAATEHVSAADGLDRRDGRTRRCRGPLSHRPLEPRARALREVRQPACRCRALRDFAGRWASHWRVPLTHAGLPAVPHRYTDRGTRLAHWRGASSASEDGRRSVPALRQS